MARPLPQFADTPPATDEQLREQLYRAAANAVREAMQAARQRIEDAVVAGQKVTPDDKAVAKGKAVVEAITELVFQQVTREGYFRFPNGFGSLKVQRLKASPRPKRLPSGAVVEMPKNRVKLRYEEGAAVREALGMPKHTNYQRRWKRESKLSKKTIDLLTGSV